MSSQGTKGQVPRELADQGYDSPDGHQDPNNHEEAGATGTELGVVDPFRDLAAPVLPPSQTVADEQRQTESNDQFGKEIVDAQ